ncbi:hypothetical protein [Lysobacter enzymogenes]|uniref:hypothetical protein n=1 Tax=Lysobacter enzymogenes TaxID=69 RepID=UPI001A971E58|nr:hypothetical protein [Lysobacter enzymogenes]QQP96247.1 hypothetical protein JHW38_24090 [Lysobacter enzymogenes]
MVISILVLLAPIAIVFSFVYLYELSTFLKGLEKESRELWTKLGSPRLGGATRAVALPLLLGRLPGLENLGSEQRRRATRLRFYLVGLVAFYIIWLFIMLFRRELGLTI